MVHSDGVLVQYLTVNLKQQQHNNLDNWTACIMCPPTMRMIRYRDVALRALLNVINV
jgi:hypothetical protein